MNAITTTHNLDFLAAPYRKGMLASIFLSDMDDSGIVAFKIGTCEGIYSTSKTSYDIIAITNDYPGNGHFEDVLQWFEFACKRDKKDLRFMEIMNEKFGKHLVNKRGFVWEGKNARKKLLNMKSVSEIIENLKSGNEKIDAFNKRITDKL